MKYSATIWLIKRRKLNEVSSSLNSNNNNNGKRGKYPIIGKQTETLRNIFESDVSCKPSRVIDLRLIEYVCDPTGRRKYRCKDVSDNRCRLRDFQPKLFAIFVCFPKSYCKISLLIYVRFAPYKRLVMKKNQIKLVFLSWTLDRTNVVDP